MVPGFSQAPRSAWHYADGMLTIVAIALALTVIPSPWGWVTVIVAGLIDVAETTFFVRWSKRRRAAVGAETLVGRTAVVVRALTPRGQVKLDGEVWEARADYDLLPGDEVVIRAVDGLLLDVEPAG
jgi:membrane protein implicated in regulation of membrane protease activity